MHPGVVIAIVAILGVSMVGVGHMTGSGSDNDHGWFSWWKSFDYKKFIGFMNSGGFGGDDDDDDDDNDGNGPHDDVDQSPIDSASISFNIGIRELEKDGEKSFQNVVDECIFSSEDSFEPLCVKCKFLDEQNNVVGQGEVIELDQSYVANTEVPIPMTSVPPVSDGAPANNDVRNVHEVKLTVCGFNCVPVYADFKDTELKHGAREAAINTAMASKGITVSGTGYNGINEVIIFDADKTGTMDPDLQVGNGLHILILPETGTLVDTTPADGYIDKPNDSAKGGTITVKMDTAFFLKSFVLVDHENDPGAVAKAYSDHAGLNVVKSVTLPITGDGKYTTVNMNAANVKRLDVTYKDSGGITNIDLKCEPEEQNCTCEKPDKFVVLYNGPDGVKVEISKKGKDKVTLPGTFNDGDEIVVDAIALGFKNGKVYPETTYNFIKYSKSIGTISIHTSCSQTLYVGQEFFYHKGQSDEIQLTVVSGTLKGEPSIPDDASCPVNPPDCDCDERKMHYEKYYDNHKKYYDDNKKKFSLADYKNYMDEHKKYLNDYGKYMEKADYKMHTDYFKKFLDDNKKKFSSSDYKKYSNDHKNYSNDYKNHHDDCDCDKDDDGKDHYDRDDHDKNDKDYKYKYGKDHDD